MTARNIKKPEPAVCDPNNVPVPAGTAEPWPSPPTTADVPPVRPKLPPVPRHAHQLLHCISYINGKFVKLLWKPPHRLLSHIN